jgi:hypothetical protein
VPESPLPRENVAGIDRPLIVPENVPYASPPAPPPNVTGMVITR